MPGPALVRAAATFKTALHPSRGCQRMTPAMQPFVRTGVLRGVPEPVSLCAAGPAAVGQSAAARSLPGDLMIALHLSKSTWSSLSV